MSQPIRDAAIACAFALSFGATSAGPQSSPYDRKLSDPETTAWREDLAYMAREMARRHKNLYHTVSKASFDSAVAALHDRIPSLERHRIILEAVLAYQPEPAVSDRMAEALAAGDLNEAIRRYRTYRADPRHVYADAEQELNGLGYRLLELKRFEQAIAIFKLNVAEHPRSANVYDSLGEAYLLAGKRELAVQNYRKSLQLDPANHNARAVLEKLGR
jgi:tetratricopeptide (TPR) repeat protein